MNEEYYNSLTTGQLNDHLTLVYDYNSDSHTLINSSNFADRSIQFVSSVSAKNLIAENLDELPSDKDLLRLPKVKLGYVPDQSFGIVDGSKQEKGFNLFNFHNEPNFYNLDSTEKHLLNDNIYSLLLNLFEDDLGVNYALNWLAYMVQREKNETALLLFGIQGSGKGTLINLMKRVIGSQNIVTISNSHLKSDFNEDRIGKRLVSVNEVNSFDRNQDVNNTLKALITDSTIHINPKGKRTFEIENFGNYIISTNSDNALKVEMSDRRYSIFQSKEKLSKEIATAIYNLSDDEILDFKKLLWNRDLTAYDPRMPFENLTRKKMMMNTATKKEYLIHLIRDDIELLTDILNEVMRVDENEKADVNFLKYDGHFQLLIYRTNLEKVLPLLYDTEIQKDLALLKSKRVLTSRLAVILYREVTEEIKATANSVGRFYQKFFGISKVFKIAKNQTIRGFKVEA